MALGLLHQSSRAANFDDLNALVEMGGEIATEYETPAAFVRIYDLRRRDAPDGGMMKRFASHA